MDKKTEILKGVMECVKWGNTLPIGPERDLCVSYPLFVKILKKHEETVIELMNKVLKLQHLPTQVSASDDHDVTNEFISDCVDNIMEKVGLSLDEAAGHKKNVLVVNANVQHVLTRKYSTADKIGSPFRLTTAKLVARPQINFKINNKNEPFIPKITDKPNSLRPLAILYDPDENGGQYCHPYEFEIEKYKPLEGFITEKLPIEPKPIEATEVILVDSEEKLKTMLSDLETQTEIAVDLEHHNYRSYLGLTCLIQISTRDRDYIVDTLVLWEKLQALNVVFTDPKILKVMHGAEGDIVWLQRDFGVYVVNLFDTYQAAKYLEMSRKSLAFLLDHYLHINVNKTYQLADWRIRPLPEEMLKYAREDTHYLLYIYDVMKNELIHKGKKGNNLLHGVIESSRQVCLKKYEKPRTDDESHLGLYWKSKKMFDPRQMTALKELFLWRDKVAREEDESTNFVLPNHQLLQISEHLPREMQGLLACCNPVPPTVKQHLHALHQIVLKARDVPMEVASSAQPLVVQSKFSTGAVLDIAEDRLACIHDFSHCDPQQDIPTLLTDDLIQSVVTAPIGVTTLELKEKPDLELFSQKSEEGQVDRSDLNILKKFVTPYRRYVRHKELQAEMKAKEEKKKMSIKENAGSATSNADNSKEKLQESFLSLNRTVKLPGQPAQSTEDKKPSSKPVVDSNLPSIEELLESSPQPLRNLMQQTNKKKKRHTNVSFDTNPVASTSEMPPPSESRGAKRKSDEIAIEDFKKAKSQPQKEVESFAYEASDYSMFDQNTKQKKGYAKPKRDKRKQNHIQRHGTSSVTYTGK